MKKFKEFVELDEKLITLGRKRPKFNTVVILAGGAGSGKGFVSEKLLGIDAKVFDVDVLKTAVLKSNKYKQLVKDEYGHDLDSFNLKNIKDVSKLHQIVKDLKIGEKHKEAFFKSVIIAPPDRKPNIVFDVTLANVSKLHDITRDVQELGYEKKDIHVIWVINELATAQKQNLDRERVVHPDILLDTHKMVSYTISEIVKGGEIRKYIDGDFWFVFNKKYVDSAIDFSVQRAVKQKGLSGSFTGSKDKDGKVQKGSYIKDVIYTKVKEQGKAMKSFDEIGDAFIDKIKQYVPDKHVWEK